MQPRQVEVTSGRSDRHAHLFTFSSLPNAPWNVSGHWHAEPLSLRQHVGNRKTTGPAHSRVANPTGGAMDAGKTGTPGADQRLVSFDDRQETEQPARLAAATLGFLSKPAPELSGR